MLSFLRQTQGEQVCGNMISVWTFCASGLTTCEQTALSCILASSRIFIEVAEGAVCPGMSEGQGGRDEIYAGLCSWGSSPESPCQEADASHSLLGTGHGAPIKWLDQGLSAW